MSYLELEEIPLGKNTSYTSSYDPQLLFPISRETNRKALNIIPPLPFDGLDLWNAYELSWLEANTLKPRIAMAEFYIPCQSEYLIESKSLKLYLNSLNQTAYKNETELKTTLQNDLSTAVGASVRVNLLMPPFQSVNPLQSFSGINLDDIPVSIDSFTPQPDLLTTEPVETEETLYSNLFKTNCPITNQPDWASLYIHYEGLKINHVGLLKYIISYREHQGFHEDCVERIFMDILLRCEPKRLTVYARYTRRGGLDINPFRSNFQPFPLNVRNFRQ